MPIEKQRQAVCSRQEPARVVSIRPSESEDAALMTWCGLLCIKVEFGPVGVWLPVRLLYQAAAIESVGIRLCGTGANHAKAD